MSNTCLQRQLTDSASINYVFTLWSKQKRDRNSLFVSARSVHEMPQNQYEITHKRYQVVAFSQEIDKPITIRFSNKLIIHANLGYQGDKVITK